MNKEKLKRFEKDLNGKWRYYCDRHFALINKLDKLKE
jgi:hypothetical protein